MSTASIQDLVTEYLPDAVESSDLSLTHMKYSFLVGMGAFIVLLPFCRSRKSFFDALAARQTIWFARLFIFAELLLLFILYYFYFERGSPLKSHKYLAYGNGDNWLYSYGRPTAGLAFIGMGMLGEVHPVVRMLCMIGCMGEVFGDALSAYQVRDYYRQVLYHSAPRGGYSNNELLAYYWRDIVSLGVSTTAFMFMALLTVMMGFCEPQLIHPSLVSGKNLDRYAAMRSTKEQRKFMAMDGLLGPQKDNGIMGVLKSRQAAANQQTKGSLSLRPAAEVGASAGVSANVGAEVDNEGRTGGDDVEEGSNK